MGGWLFCKGGGEAVIFKGVPDMVAVVRERWEV